MSSPSPQSITGRFDIAAIAAKFPATADTLLIDEYLTNNPHASTRVFRVYKSTPPHYHATCDEQLYVFSGRGTFWMADPANVAEFGPGQLLYFKRGTVHALPEILEQPLVFLAIDTPRRDPKDIIFVNPADGTPESFVRPLYWSPKPAACPHSGQDAQNPRRCAKYPLPNIAHLHENLGDFWQEGASTPPPPGSHCWRRLKLVNPARWV